MHQSIVSPEILSVGERLVGAMSRDIGAPTYSKNKVVFWGVTYGNLRVLQFATQGSLTDLLTRGFSTQRS